ncbi:MAG: NUDIX domain-containing protein [Patescibacteria group bacterium]|jgi:8-oxo-dGTP diphosphatase|nr:NUDIX domain-containing protein [Patescibacteria group bacterium]
MNNFEAFNISQVGILIRDNKCLILEFSKSPGIWGLPGGRVDEGENREDAFKRELKEELNFDNFVSRDIIDYDFYRLKKGPVICGIARYIENETDEIKLSHEHLSYKWIREDEAGDYDYFWNTLPGMVRKGFEYHRKISQ